MISHQQTIPALALVLMIIVFITSACTGATGDSGNAGLSNEEACRQLSSGSGYADLSWQAPTEDTNGAPLPATGDYALAGYIIYFGPASGEVSCTRQVEDATATSFRVSGLVTNVEYIFSVTAYNTLYAESDFSNVIVKTVLQ